MDDAVGPAGTADRTNYRCGTPFQSSLRDSNENHAILVPPVNWWATIKGPSGTNCEWTHNICLLAPEFHEEPQKRKKRWTSSLLLGSTVSGGSTALIACRKLLQNSDLRLFSVFRLTGKRCYLVRTFCRSPTGLPRKRPPGRRGIRERLRGKR